jgi:hypothetical protein
MRTNQWIVISLGVVLVSLIILFYFFLGPAAYKINSLGKIDKTEVAYRDNYKLHTTPLPNTVVEDLCIKLNLKDTSKYCASGAVVYAPYFFEGIKTYFKNLPKQDKTYDTVQSKLDPYLVMCEPPDFEGYFRCSYDFRGDGVYPVFFYFDKEGFYQEIIANSGGDS